MIIRRRIFHRNGRIVSRFSTAILILGLLFSKARATYPCLEEDVVRIAPLHALPKVLAGRYPYLEIHVSIHLEYVPARSLHLSLSFQSWTLPSEGVQKLVHSHQTYFYGFKILGKLNSKVSFTKGYPRPRSASDKFKTSVKPRFWQSDTS